MSSNGEEEDATAQINALIAKRETVFAQITATLNSAQTTGAMGISQFLARCSEIEKLRDRFTEFNERIMELNVYLPRPQQHDCNQPMLAFDGVYFEIRATEANLKSRFENKGPASPEFKAKLPTLNVPVWDGQLKTFPNWFALFNSAVHNGPYTDTVKLTYLRTLISGPALSLIEDMEISDANYKTAYDLIEDRYANKRLLATYYVTKMLDFKPFTHESASEMQSFLSVFDTSYKAYKNLNVPDPHDFIIFQCAFRCLPQSLRTVFERSGAGATEIPTFEQLRKFVRDQCMIKELHAQNHSTPKTDRPVKTAGKQHSRTTTLLVTPSKDGPSKSCVVCSQNHGISNCETYKALSSQDRYETMKKLHRCFRCLGAHSRLKCKSSVTCSECNSAKHHSSLHNNEIGTGPQVQSTNPMPSQNPNSENPKTATPTVAPYSQVPKTSGSSSKANDNGNVANANTLFTGVCSRENYVLLGTAQAFMKTKWGEWAPVRLVVDVGSQLNLITAECCQRLGLRVIQRATQLSGAMDKMVGSSNGVVSCTLASRKPHGPQWTTEATIVHKVCSELPTVKLHSEIFEKFKHLELADRSFHEKGKVDFLLGAALYPQIFKTGYQIIQGEPCAMETAFGFIVVGNVPLVSPTPDITLFTCAPSLEDLVKRFWEAEEVETRKHVDPLHALAEQHFMETHQRLEDGAFCVRLPFKPNHENVPFGKSEEIAKRRWYNVEAKLRKNPKLHEAYNQFMDEYERLGHMKAACEPGVYFIPHFAILRDSATSPLRVVFDGSCRDTSNVSLNERLLVGPPLQQDITEIITHFRLKPVAITADIKMMYRGIWCAPPDRKYQHILWRRSPDQPLKEYELSTVTYGLSSSPFQAMRCLKALVDKEGKNYPLAAEAIANSCLMDDICWSVDDVLMAVEYRKQLTELLGLAGFELRKWSSSSPEALEGVPEEHRAKVLNLNPEETESLRILGLQWKPTDDVFSYQINLPGEARTKRAVLSQLASVFDPMGWLAPVVFWGKVFFQELWVHNYDWDTTLAEDARTRWAEYSSQLTLLSQLNIPRDCVQSNATHMQLVGFCDGSGLGYGAAVYLRCSNEDESVVSTHLIKAKSKVAPLKPTTIPRMELHGAVLLTKLVKSLQFLIYRLSITEIILFTDATVVLSWLSTPPHQLKTYVANRVAFVLETTQRSMWRHVSTNHNAADCISRGLTPLQFVNYSSWWAGPEFLVLPMSSWPQPEVSEPPPSIPEIKPAYEKKVLAVTKRTADTKNTFVNLTEKFSRLYKVQRVMGFVLRFVFNARKKKIERCIGPLVVDELKLALDYAVKATQRHYFSSDIRAIQKGRVTSKTIRSLSPYVDGEGFLRVGGRLVNSLLPHEGKHPLLLPKNGALSKLICDAYHKILLHAGPQTTQARVVSRYWILSARSLIRQRVHACHTCYKSKADLQPPIMAALPAVRVTPALRAFYHASVDMAGPIPVKESTRRNAKATKAYVAVFVCMATKAVHLELVGDLSTAAFQAALDRFIARRGLPMQIYCDQGRNFVGASNELQETRKFLLESEPQLVDYLASREIKFCFNSPASPWKGGLWEAAVKSMKQHLYKITHNRLLTYEETSTFLAKIEAVLNSRPLCPGALSDPETAVDALTPGHFLIGSPLLAPPELDLSDVSENHLSRWQAVHQASQLFWRRWSKEYLNTLIQRKKWNVERPPLKEGDVVFVLQEDTRPLDWPLGRIVRLVPGTDKISRTAIVRTTSGTYTRPVAKIISLPSQD